MNALSSRSSVVFGVGGFGGNERHVLAEVKSDYNSVMAFAEAARDVGFWTNVSHHLTDNPKTVIEARVGLTIKQEG